MLDTKQLGKCRRKPPASRLTMADLDSPLKQLVSAFITDFAVWLLHADVREAHALNVELPGGMLTADVEMRGRLLTALVALLS